MPIKDVSGEIYDYTKTYTPERPYIHDYTTALTTKIFVSKKIPGGNTEIYNNFEKILEEIKIMDKVSLGIPKIAYLVGFQYYGHDSGYPAMFEVNEKAKSPNDKTAKESLLKLMDEAFKYNTTVSFHINMSDAYKESPLWDEYFNNGLICTDFNGEPVKDNIWDGEQCYHVCYEREWAAGKMQWRIDKLLEEFPIEKAGTIHLDAMHNPCVFKDGLSPCSGNWQNAIATRRKLIRYFRDRGVDVTSEHYYIEPNKWDGEELFIGLQPLSWHFSSYLEDYITRPASLMVGGIVCQHFRGQGAKKWATLFGEGAARSEDLFYKNYSNEEFSKNFFEVFCLTQLPFVFLNHQERLSVEVQKNDTIAKFANGVETHIKDKLITQNGVTLRKDTDLILPALWKEEDNLVAYSKEGGIKTWNITTMFNNINKVNVRKFNFEGLSEEVQTIDVVDGTITLTHNANEAYYITLNN